MSGELGAVSTVKTLATMRTQVKTTLTDLQAKGELKSAFASSSACNSLTSGK